MREILGEVLRYWTAGERVGMATVIGTAGSAPRPVGASMFVTPTGDVVGSVSGGCVEGAVYDLCLSVCAEPAASRHRFGVSDDEAFAVGLTCGGTLDVLVQPVDLDGFPEFAVLVEHVEAGTPVALAQVVRHPDINFLGRRLVVTEGETIGSLGEARLEDHVANDARGLLTSGATSSLNYSVDGTRMGNAVEISVISFAQSPRLIVFGAIDFATALASIGSFIGYSVTVCDARPVFATSARFPGAEVVCDWPHRYLAQEVARCAIDARTAICVLTHDPKFDVPVLEVALRLPDSIYVGAMGSRRTHDDRVGRLLGAGVTQQEIARLASPIGLDLGAQTPEETAVSIAAELISRRTGGTGVALANLSGQIHRTSVEFAR